MNCGFGVRSRYAAKVYLRLVFSYTNALIFINLWCSDDGVEKFTLEVVSVQILSPYVVVTLALVLQWRREFVRS